MNIWSLVDLKSENILNLTYVPIWPKKIFCSCLSISPLVHSNKAYPKTWDWIKVLKKVPIFFWLVQSLFFYYGAIFKNYLILEKLISKRCFKKFYSTLMNTCKFSIYFRIFHTNTRSLRSLDVWHGKYGNSC